MLGAKLNSSMITDHPYYPLEVEIASYLANEWSVPVLLGIFAATCAAIFVGTRLVVNKVHPNLPSTEKAAIWWFILCRYSRAVPEHLDEQFERSTGQLSANWCFCSGCNSLVLRRYVSS